MIVADDGGGGDDGGRQPGNEDGLLVGSQIDDGSLLPALQQQEHNSCEKTLMDHRRRFLSRSARSLGFFFMFRPGSIGSGFSCRWLTCDQRSNRSPRIRTPALPFCR